MKKSRGGRKPMAEEDRRIKITLRLAPETVALLREHGNAGKLLDALVEQYFKIKKLSA